LQVSDAEVDYRDGKAGRTWQIGIRSVTLAAAGDALGLEVDGRILGLSVSADGPFDRTARVSVLEAKVDQYGYG
jgi:hypothetical protein